MSMPRCENPCIIPPELSVLADPVTLQLPVVVAIFIPNMPPLLLILINSASRKPVEIVTAGPDAFVTDICRMYKESNVDAENAVPPVFETSTPVIRFFFAATKVPEEEERVGEVPLKLGSVCAGTTGNTGVESPQAE